MLIVGCLYCCINDARSYKHQICRFVWAELLFVLKTAKGVAFEGFVHWSWSAEAFRVSIFLFFGEEGYRNSVVGIVTRLRADESPWNHDKPQRFSYLLTKWHGVSFHNTYISNCLSIPGTDNRLFRSLKYPVRLKYPPTSCQIGTENSFLRMKRPDHESDHSPVSSTDLNNAPSYFLYSWFRASSFNINKIQQDTTVCRCLFSAKLLHIFRVSIAPIIRST